MNLERALDNSNYTEQQKACIRRTFAYAGIRTLEDLDDAPVKLGHICPPGVDIYELIAHIRAWSLEQEV